MKKNIIQIDEDKCIGCGLCANTCHQGALGIVNGKAKLLKEDYCDGLGRCLPVCPTDAITFKEVEVISGLAPKVGAGAKADVNADMREVTNDEKLEVLPCGCPGTESKVFKRDKVNHPALSSLPTDITNTANTNTTNTNTAIESQLQQWPVQIKLVPVNAPYFENANLLIAADCSAFAYGDFHNKFIKNRIALIGCPKLDEGDYTEKLTAILAGNNIKSVTVARMEVPCCSGIANATISALKNCGKMIPWKVSTISTQGELLDSES